MGGVIKNYLELVDRIIITGKINAGKKNQLLLYLS